MTNLANRISATLLVCALFFGDYLLEKVELLQSDTLGLSTEVLGATQTLELVAKLGYKPTLINAIAHTNTTLKVRTVNSFDCSTALIIPKLKIQKNLPPTGVTNIELPPQKPGTKLAGTCSMGMYRFDINFN